MILSAVSFKPLRSVLARFLAVPSPSPIAVISE